MKNFFNLKIWELLYMITRTFTATVECIVLSPYLAYQLAKKEIKEINEK